MLHGFMFFTDRKPSNQNIEVLFYNSKYKIKKIESIIE